MWWEEFAKKERVEGWGWRGGHSYEQMGGKRANFATCTVARKKKTQCLVSVDWECFFRDKKIRHKQCALLEPSVGLLFV